MSLDPRALYLDSLPPPPAHFGGMGAIRLTPDPRDYPATQHPEVRALLAAGPPGSADRSAGSCEILNQGASGACVVASTEGGIQIDNNLERQICYHFDWQTLYRELGGMGANGVDSRATLQRCVDVGAPLLGGGRVKIGSYFRCDNIPGTFEAQIKAAVSTGQIAVIATLLPTTFSGTYSPGQVTSGYHQLAVCGYSGDRFWGPNSWGSWWGGGNGHPAGFYELAFSYVTGNNFLNGYTFAFFYDPFVVHGPDPGPGPGPNPDPGPGPGPGPGPDPGPGPTPVGDLTLVAHPSRLSATRVEVVVTVTLAGVPATAVVTASVGTAALGKHVSRNGRTTFILTVPAGVTVALDALDGFGHSGSTTVVV